MDYRSTQPTDTDSQSDSFEYYPTPPAAHYVRLFVAIILMVLHFIASLIITKNHGTVLFAPPSYFMTWLVFLRVTTYLICILSDHLFCEPSSTIRESAEISIIKPRIIVRNIRVGLLTFLISVGVLMWNMAYWSFALLVPIL